MVYYKKISFIPAKTCISSQSKDDLEPRRKQGNTSGRRDVLLMLSLLPDLTATLSVVASGRFLAVLATWLVATSRFIFIGIFLVSGQDLPSLPGLPFLWHPSAVLNALGFCVSLCS